MGLLDARFLGLSWAFAAIVLVRLGTLIPLWILWRLGPKPATFVAMEYAIPLNLIWWGVVFSILAILNPSSRFYIFIFAAVTAVVVSAIPVISSRVMVLSAIVWSLIILIGYVLTGSVSMPDLLGLAGALLMAGSLGRLMARRSNTLSRRNYLLLRESEAAHRALEDAHRRLEKNQEDLELIVATDTLTGAVARHEFMKRGTAEIRRARQLDKTLGVLLLDIDYFKSINDSHGHAMGDAALVAFLSPP